MNSRRRTVPQLQGWGFRMFYGTLGGTVTAPLSSLARLIRDFFSCRHKGQVNCNAEIMSCSYIAEDIQSQDCPYLVFWSTVS